MFVEGYSRLVNSMKHNNVCLNETVGNLIKDERIRQKVKLTELCAGLMSEGNLCRIESGKRETDASTIKRITDRLGMAYEEQGAYIFYDDYEEWQKRWEIIYAIETKNISQAASFIEQYISLYSGNNVRLQTDEWLGAIHDMCNKYGVWEYTTNNYVSL